MADTSPAPEPTWPILNALERRVLGVLVEKGQTTPDAYPLSMNALVNGCNQKSNRDPIMDLDESRVDDVLQELRKRGLAVIVMGTRVDRWRHQLYEVWTSNKAQLALITELLLRGPQTEGELRTRVSRMVPIESIEELREVIQPLADRKLVIYLTAQGRRGTMLTHGFHTPEELTRLKSLHSTGVSLEETAPLLTAKPVPPIAAPQPDVLARLEGRLAEAVLEIGRQKEELQAMKADVNQLRTLLDQLRQELGIAPSGSSGSAEKNPAT